MDPNNGLYHTNTISSNGLPNLDNSNQSVSPVLLNNNPATNLDVLSSSGFMAQLDVTSPRDVPGLLPNASGSGPSRFSTSVASNGVVGDRILRSVLVSGGTQYLDETSVLNSLTYFGDIEEITKADQENTFIVTFTKVEMARALLSRPHHGTSSIENMRIQPLASALSNSTTPVVGIASGIQDLSHDTSISVVPSTVSTRYPASRPVTSGLAKDSAHSSAMRGGAQLGAPPRSFYQSRRSGSANAAVIGSGGSSVNPRYPKSDTASNPRYGANNLANFHDSLQSQLGPSASGPSGIHNSWGMNTLGMSAATGNQQRIVSSNQDASSGPFLSSNPYATSSHPPMPFGPGSNVNGPAASGGGGGKAASSSYARSGLASSYLPHSGGLAPSPIYLSHSIPQDNPHLGSLTPFLGTSLSSATNGYPLPLRENYPKRILVSSNLVGAIIGRGGETIREITTSTGARVDVKREVVGWCQYTGGSATTPNTGSFANSVAAAGGKDGNNTVNVTASESQIVFICGTATATSLAVRRIMEICMKEALASGQTEKPHLGLLCEDRFCGRIIGREGKNLNAIREETAASVYVSNTPIVTQLLPPPQQFLTLDRIVDIKGTLDAICQAEQLISTKLHQCQRQDVQRYQQHGNVSSLMPYQSYLGPHHSNSDLIGLGHHGPPSQAQARLFPSLSSHHSNQHSHSTPFGAPNDASNGPHNLHSKQWPANTFQQRSMPPNYMFYGGAGGLGASSHAGSYHYSNFLPPPPPNSGFYGASMHVPSLSTSGNPHSYGYGFGIHQPIYPFGNAGNSCIWPGLTSSMLQTVLGSELEMDDALYMRIPHISAGAVIGTEGATINKIMDDTKTMVSVSKVDLQQQRSIRKEGTTASTSDTVDPTETVEESITDKSSSKAKSNTNPGNNFLINTLQRKVTIRGNPHNQMLAQWHIFQKVKNSSRLGSDSNAAEGMNNTLDNDLCLWTIIRVPRILVGRLIGKGGRTVFNIQSTTGTIINLPKDPSISPITSNVNHQKISSVDSTKPNPSEDETEKDNAVTKENQEESQPETTTTIDNELVNGSTSQDPKQESSATVTQNKPQTTADQASSIIQTHADDSLYQAVEIYGTFENTQHALCRIRSLLNQVIFQLCQQGQALHRQGATRHSPYTSSNAATQQSNTNATNVPSTNFRSKTSSLSNPTGEPTNVSETISPGEKVENISSLTNPPNSDVSPNNVPRQEEDMTHLEQHNSVNNESSQLNDSQPVHETLESTENKATKMEENVNASTPNPVQPSAIVE